MSASSARLSFRNRLLFAAALAFALPALLVTGCGTGAYPFALDPKPILVLNAYRGDFGSIPINTSSQTFTITATNTGGAPLTISPITLSGSGASQFSEFNTCTQPIAPQATCAITLGFSPTLLGSATAQVVLTSNASNGPQTIALTGTGIPTPVPVVSLSGTSLDFGSVNLGSTSSAQSVTLTNTGNAPLLISSITLTGAGASSFQIALNGCPATLPATQSCILALDFKPVAVGPLSASLVFADNAAGAPHTVALTGTGVGVPALTITPTALTFAAAGISSASAAQTVTLTNTGTANVTFTALTLGGANATSFAQTNNCATLAPNASCTASVTFSPTALGALSATLNIADNVPGSPQAVALSGTGAAPTLTITPTSLAFPSTNVGKTSATQTSTVKNTGTVSVAITSIVLSGANATSFMETNNCPATLTAGVSCTVTAAFAPTTAGALTASVLLTDSATGSPQAIALTGTGAGSPLLTITPATLSFGTHDIGKLTTAKVVTVKNTGNAAASFSSIALAGTDPADFRISANTCGTSLAVASTCTVSVKFKALNAGKSTAKLDFTDNATGSPQTVTLNGTGNGPVITVTAALKFANTTVGKNSAKKSVTVSNTGNATATFTSFTLTGANAGDFVIDSKTCGNTLAAAATCTVTLQFEPKAGGARTATLDVADDATAKPASPQTSTLTGTALQPIATLSPTSLTFAATDTGVATAAQVVTLTNTGTAAMTITSIAITGADASSFTETKTCGATLAVNASCTVSVVFKPTAGGALTASLAFTDNAPGSPQTVALSGTGIGAPKITLTPTTVNFGTNNVGVATAPKTITVKNTGTAAATISAIALTAPTGFSETNTCGATLAAGASCVVSAIFDAPTAGAFTTKLTVTDNATGSPQSATLKGTGTGSPALTLSPTSLNFGSLATGTSGALSVTATNTGTATLTLNSILLTGATAYTRTTTCGATLAIAASCSVTVTFAPVVTGSQSAALVFTDNAGNSPQTVGITGTATEGSVKLPTPAKPTLLYGSVVNGTAQPVSGATVKLYAFRVAGSAGQLLSTATTGADGSFYFYKTGTPTFTCPSATTPVYLLATGGKPTGFTTANTDLEMMSVLGNCGALTTAVVNEATTVAGISAMANFISNDTTITWTANTLPVFNAQLAVALELVDPTTGVVPGTLPAGATADVAKINSLANILYTCTHSAGGVAGDGSPCAALFAATTGIPDLGAPTPTETFTAMFNIAEYVAPWIKGVAALEQTSGKPFAPDWTTVPLDLMPIVMPLTQAPTFSPAAGTFTGSVAVTITSPTLGAQVYYTTDGSTPTTASTPYLTPITLTSGVTTLRAVAYENAMTVSAASTANYIVNGPHITLNTASPTIAVAPTTPVTTTLTLSAPSTTALTVTLTSGAPNALSLKPTTATATATITVPAGTTTTTFPVYGLNAGSVLLKATATGYGDGILRISPTLLTSATTVTSKSPIRGFTAVGYQGMNSTGGPDDNSLTQLTVDPGVWAGAVINIRWNEMEPTEGSYDFSAIELGLKNLAAANNATGSHVAAKIRVFANSNVPSFLLSEEGGGIWMGPGGNGTGPENHDALFWSTHYETHFVALMNALAAEYDASSRVQEMVGSACANTTDEPFIMDITTISTGYNDGATQYPSMHQQGENDAAMRECEEHQAQDYTAWKVTPLYTPFSTFRISDLSTRFILATGFTLEQMRAFFEQRGALGIEGNQALEPESVIDAIPSQLPVFDTFPVITSLGGNVGMQTNTQGALNQVCTNSGTGDDFVCWNPTVAYGVKQTGREIELWQTTNAPFPVAGGQGQAQYSLSDVQYWLNQYPQLH